MMKEEVQKRIGELGKWYHPINFGSDIKVPLRYAEGLSVSEMGRHNLIREVRKGIEYKDKLVLDLGCAEGMWSYEAENLGAKQVLGVDISHPDMIKRVFFAKEALKSSVIFYFNVFVEDLYNRLDHYFNWHTKGEKFDVVQHLGLLYHLRDPLRSLSQARRCIKKKGKLLLETALYDDNSKESLCLFNWKSRIFNDGTTWWAPNKVCLLAMLRLSLFEPDESSLHSISSSKNGILRTALVAEAVGIETVSDQVGEVLRQGVHIGLDADV